MNEFQLRLIAEGLIVNDNKKEEIVKKLINFNYDEKTINTYQNIINELLVINDYERAFGCPLTPIKGEKSLDELEAEKERLDAIRKVSDVASSDVDNYIFLSKFRTSNHLSQITNSLEKTNSCFMELHSILVERYSVTSSIERYEYKDKQYIKDFYYSLRNNNNSNLAK